MIRVFSIALAGIVLAGAEHPALAQNECVPVVKHQRGYDTRTELCGGTIGGTTPAREVQRATDVILLSVVKELRAQNALLTKQNELLQQQITSQAAAQSRLEDEILAQQKVERELVTAQIANIPVAVATDDRVIAALSAALASDDE